jgi:cytochrome c2
MNKKYLYLLVSGCVTIASGCNQNKPTPETTTTTTTTPAKTDTVVMSMGMNSKGIGRFSDVKLTHPLDDGMVAKGQAIAESKCAACHKMTDEKLVGPGWKGVTDRRAPEWIMNFITNTQVMLDKDLVAQSEVVTCIVRMPNQDLTDEQARQVLEFMRKNDGKN